jgi:glycosyltransferase involved in cell wall biosynthesis
MQGENIICFAKDWNEDPTSNNHVMKVLARGNKVLWLNSIGMRAPDLKKSADVGKIVRKLKSFAKGPVEVEKNLWVYTPIVVPLPHTPWATAINERILQATLAALRRRLGMGEFQLWTFLPNAGQFVGKLGESLVVYYCIDEWSQFSYIDGGRMAALERTLCGRADVVFATARTLWESRRPWNPETFMAPHGVDFAHFSKALEAPGDLAPELADVKGPVLGFFGLVHEWIDLEIFAHVARARPDWTVAIIGKASVDTSRLAGLPNVRLLGRKPYAELPRFCRSFSVGLMPFAVNELTKNVNPIKMREYLCAGLPVVSTDLPEARPYESWCKIARSPDEFLAACDEAIRADSPERRRERSRAMQGETWEAKVVELGERVMAAKLRRLRRAA